jgi:hypothetical protein
MIDDLPVAVALDQSEAVARRQGLRRAVLLEGEGVVAGVDRGVAVDPDIRFSKITVRLGNAL